MRENTPTSKHQQFAELLDNKFRIPGTDIRFGIDPIVGLIPGAGDWLGAVASLYFMVHAAVLKAKVAVLLRMLLNILVDLFIGAIPLLGEIFDVRWKANLRNAELLQDLKQNPDDTTHQSKLVVWFVCIISIVLVFALLYLIGWILISLIQAIL
jgi:NAD/NADP transhydrogenase beta subunit